MKIPLQRLAQLVLLHAGLSLVCQALAAESEQPHLLTTMAEVRNLTVAEAKSRYPVKLRGVVTFYDDKLFSRFIQDATAGIYLRETNVPALTPGQVVEVEGFTSPGEYAPVIMPTQVRIVGAAELPNPHPVTFERLASGKEDSQYVEIAGIVRSVYFDESSKHYLMELATGGGRLTVYATDLPVSSAQNLVDSTVRIRGVCSSQFNRQRQLFAIRLLVPRAGDVAVEIFAPVDPFAVPMQNIGGLFQFTPQDTYGHRVKISGTVSYFQPGVALYLRNGNNGLLVQTKSTAPLKLGEQVEAIGFAASGQYTPMLQDASYRKIADGLPPTPTWINRDEALKGDFDCRLVRIEAELLNRANDGREQSLTLKVGGVIFQAYQQAENAQPYARLENGSLLAITGICLVNPGNWEAGETWRAKSFRILMRGPGDVVVLHSPPWWTLEKMLWLAGAMLFVLLVALTWIAVLRRRVHKQTRIIRSQLQVEAELKERYLDLFENANDMVFTHDLEGRITSINYTGERLLHRGRAKLLSMKLVDLIAEDQRAAAQVWLDQIVNGADLSTTEWDFLNATGNRVKLDISSRLINAKGKAKEVEGIARDVTERKRLEKEILEVSNREQRRIGHDLHDGVCQQLAATTYLIDILADQLQEKNCPESAEAERISRLINETITQTRRVARGLFPVKLEESGLASALEELASNTTALFKIDCRFHCTAPPPDLDNSTSLHLYYIAQESLLNAAKHGKAEHANISLSQSNNRLILTVEDDGVGINSPATGEMTGMGIRIMRYRARVIGGTLNLKSRPNNGTQVKCELHLPGK